MERIKIYILDGYLLTRLAHRKYFEDDSRFEVLGDFSCAFECLEQMKKRPADVVLADIELGDINGIEAIDLIKKNFPRTKVIILTASDDENKILASLACGACAYVVKGLGADLKKIISIVSQGGFWMNLEVAKTAFATLPLPDLKNLEHLYKSSDLKNILTQRELEVLKLLCQGKTNSQIAEEIIVSINTAKAHVGNILNKLCVTDRVQAAVMAVKANLF